jgi:hypothetical protein
MSTTEILEAAMLLIFSLSWCCSVAKMLRCKVSSGKSILFVMLVCLGYALGLCSKLWAWRQTGQFSAVAFIYGWNLFITACDALLVHHYARDGSPSEDRHDIAADRVASQREERA